jgi:hypothetical protein
MVFEKYCDFLTGRKFSNGLRVKIPKNKLTFRDKYLSDLVAGKKVIHFGFLDHLPLLDKKIKENRWLHAKLIAAAEACIVILEARLR